MERDSANTAWDDLLPVLKAREQELEEEHAAIAERLKRTAPPADPPHMARAEERAAARLLWRKKFDEKAAVIAFHNVFLTMTNRLDQAYDKNMRNHLMRLGFPSDAGLPASLADRLQALVKQLVEEEEALSFCDGDSFLESASTESDSVSEPAILEQRLIELRNQYNVRMEDPSGRISTEMVHTNADNVKQAGFTYPPSTVVAQYGLTKNSEWLYELDRARRKYKKLKRRLREKGVQVQRALSDDTEYSWNIDDDGDGSGSEGENVANARRVYKWKMSLPGDMPTPERRRESPQPSIRSLRSMQLGSQVSNWIMSETKYVKRREMWLRLERQRTNAALEGRGRSKRPPERKRILRRKLNNFMRQMPEYWRYSNATKRHPNGSERSSHVSGPSSHGEFQWWDRAEDPVEE